VTEVELTIVVCYPFLSYSLLIYVKPSRLLVLLQLNTRHSERRAP